MRLAIAGLGLALALTPTGAAQEAKTTRIRGYVIEIVSPTALTLDDYRLDQDRTYRVNLERVPGIAGEILRVGAEVELEGVSDATGQFLASRFKRLPPPEDHTPSTATISTVVPFDPGERSYWNSLRIDVKEPNFDRRRSGGVTIRFNTHYEITANAEIQRYIAELGWRLVPPFQRDLPLEDRARIPFKFYVGKQDDVGASALPNGVVLVFSRTFEVMQNEAQLASVMAHEIAHVVQKHLWKLSQMPVASIKTDYTRAFENQADRLALQYTLAAGYDPREAAKTWRLMAKKLGFSPLRGSHENYAIRRAFMMNELDRNYRQLEYGTLKVGDDPFKHIAEVVKKPY